MFAIIAAVVVAYVIYRIAMHLGESKSEATLPPAISTAASTFKQGVSTIPTTVKTATTSAQAAYREAQEYKDVADLLQRLQKNPNLIAQIAAEQTEQKLNSLTPPPPPPPPAR